MLSRPDFFYASFRTASYIDCAQIKALSKCGSQLARPRHFSVAVPSISLTLSQQVMDRAEQEFILVVRCGE